MPLASVRSHSLDCPKNNVPKNWIVRLARNLSNSCELSDLGSLVLNPNPWFLLRKEVIQPQVPLRLPCYDFIPITSHTFGTF